MVGAEKEGGAAEVNCSRQHHCVQALSDVVDLNRALSIILLPQSAAIEDNVLDLDSVLSQSILKRLWQFICMPITCIRYSKQIHYNKS